MPRNSKGIKRNQFIFSGNGFRVNTTGNVDNNQDNQTVGGITFSANRIVVRANLKPTNRLIKELQEEQEEIKAIVEELQEKNNTACAVVQQRDTLLHEFDRFRDFYDCILKVLKEYLCYFQDASYNDLTEGFTTEFYNSLANLVVEKFSDELNIEECLKYENVYDSTLFDTYKENTFKVINGLNRAIQLYKVNENQRVKILSLEEKENILEDMTLLQEYINSLNKNMFLINETVALNTQPLIKPEYALYFERHGLPPEGVFDSEKLAIIIKELLDNGTITEEDVFGTNTIDCSENIV